MSIVVIVLLGLASVIALLLITALFVRKDYSVERRILISRPRQEVFDYIRFLKNQDNFSKWASLDPQMKKEFTGTDGTVGFTSAWEGNKKVGKGEQEIKKITDGERIDFELRFIKPFPGMADAYMTTEAAGESETTVRWGLRSTMKYPMNILLLVMNMDKMIGNDFAVGLAKLKTVLEQSPTR